MNPNQLCRCRINNPRSWYPYLHLCATECAAMGHFADELDYAFAIHQAGPLQLRLF